MPPQDGGRMFFDNSREGRTKKCHGIPWQSGVVCPLGTGKTKRERARSMNVMDYRDRPEHVRRERLQARGRPRAGSDGKYGQARKGPWWMPRSYCTMKAVVSCEKPGGGAHIPRSPDGRMG